MPKPSHLVVSIALIFGVVAPIAACTDETSTARKDPNMKTVVIPVEGMSCASCASKVKRALKDIPGVGDAVIDLGERHATVDYDPRQLGLDRLVAAINGTGFKAGAPAESTR